MKERDASDVPPQAIRRSGTVLIGEAPNGMLLDAKLCHMLHQERIRRNRVLTEEEVGEVAERRARRN